MADAPTVYSVTDVAQLLGVSKRKLHDILKEFPYYRLVGRKKIFTAADVDRPARFDVAARQFPRIVDASTDADADRDRANPLVEVVAE